MFETTSNSCKVNQKFEIWSRYQSRLISDWQLALYNRFKKNLITLKSFKKLSLKKLKSFFFQKIMWVHPWKFPLLNFFHSTVSNSQEQHFIFLEFCFRGIKLNLYLTLLPFPVSNTHRHCKRMTQKYNKSQGNLIFKRIFFFISFRKWILQFCP